MLSIMPPGYSRGVKRRRLENELRQARAGELAGADKKQRARIEKEFRAEVNRRLGKDRWRIFPCGPDVLWQDRRIRTQQRRNWFGIRVGRPCKGDGRWMTVRNCSPMT
jgi:hypothetical protein